MRYEKEVVDALFQPLCRAGAKVIDAASQSRIIAIYGGMRVNPRWAEGFNLG